MTTISSAAKSVTIGGGAPTVVIGERINPTGKARLSEALLKGDWEYVASMARRQVEAGAAVLDVNVGVPGIDEPTTLRKAVEVVSGVVDAPLCIDSPNAQALEAALSVYKGKALINSVTGEEESLQRVLPLAKRFGAAVVGLTQDDEGVPMEVDRRVAIARKIVERAGAMGIPAEDIVIDCVVMAVSADSSAGPTTLESVYRISHELGLNVSLGASNVSFGLPDRRYINSIFLSMAIGAGMAAAIVDPTVPEVMRAIITADMLAGRDEYARRYLTHYRSMLKAQEA